MSQQPIFNTLGFESGLPTIADPSHIKEIGKHNGVIDGVKMIELGDNHRLFLEGEFGGYRLYCIVTHARPEIIPDSVRWVGEKHFAASLRLELKPGEVTTHDVVFKTPIEDHRLLEVNTYGLFPDAFAFRKASSTVTESYICDASFLTNCAQNAPLLPLHVRYIGIAKAANREAHNRLGEGHEKLQDLLAEQNRRPSRQAVSIVLYRPTNFDPPILLFPDVLETIEAMMIQYFKPSPRNVRCIDFPHDSPELLSKIRSTGAKFLMNKLQSPKGTQLYSDRVAPLAEHEIILQLP